MSICSSSSSVELAAIVPAFETLIFQGVHYLVGSHLDNDQSLCRGSNVTPLVWHSHQDSSKYCFLQASCVKSFFYAPQVQTSFSISQCVIQLILKFASRVLPKFVLEQASHGNFRQALGLLTFSAA